MIAVIRRLRVDLDRPALRGARVVGEAEDLVGRDGVGELEGAGEVDAAGGDGDGFDAQDAGDGADDGPRVRRCSGMPKVKIAGGDGVAAEGEQDAVADSLVVPATSGALTMSPGERGADGEGRRRRVRGARAQPPRGQFRSPCLCGPSGLEADRAAST